MYKRQEYEQKALQVLRSGWYVLGKEVEAFEKEWAAYIGAKHCVGLASGLDALWISFRLLGVGAGDEVIVCSNAYIACVTVSYTHLMCGIYSTRKLEQACRKNIDFIWLLQGERVPDHTSFARFRSGKAKDAIEDLFYQFVRRLWEEEEIEYEEVFIDGTKTVSYTHLDVYKRQGIGLPLARSIARGQQGDVTAENTPEGPLFRLRLFR